MNQLIKLKYCQYFLKHLHKNLPKCRNHYAYSSYIIMQNFHENCWKSSVSYSFCQIRGFAKKAQGKLLKSGKARKIQLSDEEMSDVINIQDYRDQLQQVAEKLKQEYVQHLSLRSAITNIENVIVKIDDEEYPLNELAVISKKNPNLVAVNMVDFPEGLKPAIKAITESGSGVNPQQDGTMIYLNVPKITREHRETLVKNAKSLFIKAKEEVRAVQNSFIKEAKLKTELSEDLVFNASNQIMAMAEQCVAELEKIMKTKQKELLGDS